MTIANRIREIRKQKNLSQTAFGERLGVRKDVIVNIENLRVQPKPLLIDGICKEFNVNKDWLLNGVGEMYTLSEEDAQLAELFAELTVNENPKLQKAILQLCELKEEYIDMILPLITELNNKNKSKC